eukprot:m.202727 g.202727  ORF g.202727 m.202727 type:complete len:64 (+) comp39615_c0_seq26:917-1108(+)
MGQCKDILCKGYIIRKQQERIKTDSSSSSDKLLTMNWHIWLSFQHLTKLWTTFSPSLAVKNLT